MTRRWRPSLGLVLGGGLAGTLALSFVGLVALRYLGPVLGFRVSAVLLGIAITVLTAFLGWLMVRLLLRPIRALEAYAVAQQNGENAAPPLHFGTQELHSTARRVIAMAETLRDREATVRSFTDHVTHELKTPVAAIRAGVELLEDGGALTPEDRALLAQIDGARDQLEQQLAALRRVAQARETRYLGLCTLAELSPALRSRHPGIALEISGSSVALPMGGEGVGMMLDHFVSNAGKHGARQVWITAKHLSDRVLLEVADDGPGVSEGNAERIFDPFFTTRRETGGTGMGLAIVRQMARAHGAQVTLAERGQMDGAGALFRLAFPRTDG